MPKTNKGKNNFAHLSQSPQVVKLREKRFKFD
jgi:hypothetical protein